MGMAKLALPQEKPGAFWRDLSPTGTAWSCLDTVPSPTQLCCTTACTKQGLGPFPPPQLGPRGQSVLPKPSFPPVPPTPSPAVPPYPP